MTDWDKPSDAAAEAAVWSLIETEAKKRKDEARAWLTERMGPDLLAVKAVANGDPIGRASYVEGKESAKVTDRSLFIEFVAEVFRDEIVETIDVNSAFESALLARLERVPESEHPSHPDLSAKDPDTGFLVPGVSWVKSRPYVSVSKSKDAREKVAALLAGGGLSLDGIRALPEPEDKWTQDIEAGAIGGEQ